MSRVFLLCSINLLAEMLKEWILGRDQVTTAAPPMDKFDLSNKVTGGKAGQLTAAAEHIHEDKVRVRSIYFKHKMEMIN